MKLFLLIDLLLRIQWSKLLDIRFGPHIKDDSYSIQENRTLANQFCGSLQGGGKFMKEKNCHPLDCNTQLQKKPIQVSWKESLTVDEKLCPGRGIEPGTNAFPGQSLYHPS